MIEIIAWDPDKPVDDLDLTESLVGLFNKALEFKGSGRDVDVSIYRTDNAVGVRVVFR